MSHSGDSIIYGGFVNMTADNKGTPQLVYSERASSICESTVGVFSPDALVSERERAPLTAPHTPQRLRAL